ncbi:murein hydrolase activator EnvC family protein [Microbacterium sp. NPDC091313]
MRVSFALALITALLVPTPHWAWPVEPPRVAAAYQAPAHAYGAGHRGIDLEADGVVRAPADGVVAFAGTVVDRGIVTIDHGGGYVLTLEPVEPAVAAGDSVRRGDAVGTVAAGGHAAAGTLHVGVRRDGEYINPMLLFGSVPRAVLLPCC